MYQPALGTALVVSLPGETVRATVARVVNDDVVAVELDAPLLNPARQHSYRVGDIVFAERVLGNLGEYWEAIDERRLAEAPPKSTPKRKKKSAAIKRKVPRRKARR